MQSKCCLQHSSAMILLTPSGSGGPKFIVALETPDQAHATCFPPLKPFESRVSGQAAAAGITKEALKMYCAWPPLPGAFGWLGQDS